MDKVNEAILVLQHSLTQYQDETDKKLIELHDEVAGVKNSIRSNQNFQDRISGAIEKCLESGKHQLRKSLNEYIDKLRSSRPPHYKSNTFEKIQKLRESYDFRLLENEKYLQTLQMGVTRSKSSSRGCIDSARN
jgi:hypothetical protein